MGGRQSEVEEEASAQPLPGDTSAGGHTSPSARGTKTGDRLRSAWATRGALACALWPLSLVYGALVALRRAAFAVGLLRGERLPVPVIVVGNVVAGGAGKTPLVIALVQHLQARGLHPGVVSRGYGRRTRGVLAVDADTPAHDVGDEPALIHRRTGAPVVVGERRADAARALLSAWPQTGVLVCDDGLQHLALARDLEICVFDARGAGNGWLLPAGPLREPWPRAVDLVVHSGAPAGISGHAAQRTLADHAVTGDGRSVPLAELVGQPLQALAGVAQPEVFFDQLRSAGLTLARTTALPDHYDFDSSPINMDGGYRLICTEKDAVKLWPAQPAALAVPLRLEVDAPFWRALDARLDAQLSSGALHPPT
jgi:tetraacyldisaccharide 4'-kinase